MKKRIVFGLALLTVLLGARVVTDRVGFNGDEWIADFEQLKREVEHSYANLKWSAPVKGVDLVALNEQTMERLRAARSNAKARAALADFSRGFKDGHFRLQSGPPRPVAAVLDLWPRGGEPHINFSMSGSEVCEALGFNGKRQFVRLDHRGLTEEKFTTFPAGTLELGNGKRFGIIRIPAFRQYDYASACERAWDVFRDVKGGRCDDDCLYRFATAVKYDAAAQLAKDARHVTRSAPDGLIIDLTGNGGGTEWAGYAAAVLTPQRLRAPGVVFVRGEHWRRSFETDFEEFAADLKTDLSTAQRELVMQGLEHARALRDSARMQCDLAGIWSERTFTPACWNVAVRAPYTTATDRKLVANLTSKWQLLDQSAELQQAEPYTGKLYIMVDQNTASAAELFTAVLRDNNVATVIGTKTAGSGCGYTNGGIDIKLKHSGLVVRMPDCARLRADGSNEYAGITPDVLVDWGGSESSKGVALEVALAK